MERLQADMTRQAEIKTHETTRDKLPVSLFLLFNDF